MQRKDEVRSCRCNSRAMPYLSANDGMPLERHSVFDPLRKRAVGVGACAAEACAAS
eukprot:COSAG02_NODE_3376_length_6847_cov_2.337433_6_plen_56_part_00